MNLEETVKEIRSAVHKNVVGQHDVLDDLLLAVLVGEHALLVGLPGLGKTLLVKSLSESLGLSFKRIQFTPDLMLSDLIGIEVLDLDKNTNNRELRFVKGPVFTNILLADEINRTPPKTQSALLESMQERQVTVGGKEYKLPEPFLVLATQNPIEQEGTYTLPEAQLDRFMLEIKIDYPTEEEEKEIIEKTTGNNIEKIKPIINNEELKKIRKNVRDIKVPEHVLNYAVQLVRNTRVNSGEQNDFSKYIRYGAGPRAGQGLVLAAKAKSVISGRQHVTMEDIQKVAKPVLRHRIILNFTAKAENIKTDDVIEKIIKKTKIVKKETQEEIKKALKVD